MNNFNNVSFLFSTITTRKMKQKKRGKGKIKSRRERERALENMRTKTHAQKRDLAIM
jgi:hypothetical protein